MTILVLYWWQYFMYCIYQTMPMKTKFVRHCLELASIVKVLPCIVWYCKVSDCITLESINLLYCRICTHLATQQSARSTDSKSTHPFPSLTTWFYGSRLLFWLPLPTYFEIFWSLQWRCHFILTLLPVAQTSSVCGKAKLWAWHFGPR